MFQEKLIQTNVLQNKTKAYVVRPTANILHEVKQKSSRDLAPIQNSTEYLNAYVTKYTVNVLTYLTLSSLLKALNDKRQWKTPPVSVPTNVLQTGEKTQQKRHKNTPHYQIVMCNPCGKLTTQHFMSLEERAFN